jgi:2Fe-2S ferredoxin
MNRHVRFPGRGRDVCVASGTALIDAVRDAGLPIASSCGGEGLCGRCGVQIVESGAPLADEAADETRAKQRNRVDPSLRLACRLCVESDLSVTAPYW